MHLPNPAVDDATADQGRFPIAPEKESEERVDVITVVWSECIFPVFHACHDS